MNKVKIASLAIGVASMLALATPAFAANISGSGTAVFNGQTNLYGNAGQTKQVSTNFDIPTGQVLHAVQTDFIGDNQPPVCHTVSVYEGAQTNIPVSFSEVLPPNSGDYGFTETAFTATTVDQANALNENQGTACTGTSNVVYNQGSVVHVLPVSGSSTGTVGTDGKPAWLDAMIAAMLAALKPAPVVTPPTPTVSADCSAYAKASAGAMQGLVSDNNVKLQGFLLSEGASIPALRAGAAFGFYGNQTAAAVSWFQGVFHCN